MARKLKSINHLEKNILPAINLAVQELLKIATTGDQYDVLWWGNKNLEDMVHSTYWNWHSFRYGNKDKETFWVELLNQGFLQAVQKIVEALPSSLTEDNLPHQNLVQTQKDLIKFCETMIGKAWFYDLAEQFLRGEKKADQLSIAQAFGYPISALKSLPKKSRTLMSPQEQRVDSLRQRKLAGY